MANAMDNNVIYVDTTGYTFDTMAHIEKVLYIGASNGTALITAGTSGSGVRQWEAAGSTNIDNDVEIVARRGFHVALTNGAKVYIYLK